MFIYDQYRTVMFTEIESFSVTKNWRGGKFGNAWITTKSGNTIMFSYYENNYGGGEVAETKISDIIRDHILNNKPLHLPS